MCNRSVVYSSAINAVTSTAELVDKLRDTDPETLTPLEALNLVYELKNIIAE